jgi:hypothetical protein
MFEIIDNNGTIHSGHQVEMEIAFNAMIDNDDYFDETSPELIEQYKSEYQTDWVGDLKLIKIIQTSR